MVVFDCSVELDNIISENNLIYWINFLETQLISKENQILLIGTKVDVIEKKFSTLGFGGRDKVDGALFQIHKSKFFIKLKIFLSLFFFQTNFFFFRN